MISPAVTVLRVLCSSLAGLPQVQGSVMQELLAMREQLGAFNAAHGVRSALLHSAGWVFQWHEGPAAGVEKLLRIARQDQRHGRMRVLHRSVGRATLDEPVQIVSTHGLDKPTDVARRLFRLTQGQALEGPAQPDELWRELVAPSQPAGAGMAGSVLVRHEVVAVTSGNSGAVDLVRSLGDRVRAPVTYQRFASGVPAAADVGAAYVDVPGPCRSMRLQALARRSLAFPMVRLLMRDVQCVLLLLGDHAGANLALTEDVGQLLAQLDTRPALRLSGADPASTQAAFACLQVCSGDIAQAHPSAFAHAGPEALFELLLGARGSQRISANALPA